MSKTEKPYVLVVDDNAETCTLLTALLQRDFVVDIAADGLEAVEKIRTRRYGSILLDLRMPQHDGFSVLDFLKESQPDVLRSVIIVTALLSSGEISRARAYNVCAIVAKPFDIDMLLSAVRDCVHTEGGRLGGVFCSPVILLLADLLRQRLM
jgi:CheY-like chemotaxis protein